MNRASFFRFFKVEKPFVKFLPLYSLWSQLHTSFLFFVYVDSLCLCLPLKKACLIISYDMTRYDQYIPKDLTYWWDIFSNSKYFLSHQKRGRNQRNGNRIFSWIRSHEYCCTPIEHYRILLSILTLLLFINNRKTNKPVLYP